MSIWRVTVSETRSVQPQFDETSWTHQVIYCGADFEEAAAAYVAEELYDYGSGSGNPARRTIIQKFHFDDIHAAVIDLTQEEDTCDDS